MASKFALSSTQHVVFGEDFGQLETTDPLFLVVFWATINRFIKPLEAEACDLKLWINECGVNSMNVPVSHGLL